MTLLCHSPLAPRVSLSPLAGPARLSTEAPSGFCPFSHQHEPLVVAARFQDLTPLALQRALPSSPRSSWVGGPSKHSTSLREGPPCGPLPGSAAAGLQEPRARGSAQSRLLEALVGRTAARPADGGAECLPGALWFMMCFLFVAIFGVLLLLFLTQLGLRNVVSIQGSRLTEAQRLAQSRGRFSEPRAEQQAWLRGSGSG